MWKAAGRARGHVGSVVVSPSWHTRPVALLCWEELELEPEPLRTAPQQQLAPDPFLAVKLLVSVPLRCWHAGHAAKAK